MFSIAHSGMALFDHPIRSTIGGIEIDLASGPIQPGHHKLEIEATIGGIEIYVPKHVKFTVEGGALVGGYDVHDGLPWYTRAYRRMQKLFGMTAIPSESVPSPDPTAETTIHFVIEGGIGGIDVYRV
ncbi:MAG TPA: LiaF domain-containing protein [Kofleriaceae bacterium]|nr:LiaF domain-containing protein [Kofleriaceae bacterium]